MALDEFPMLKTKLFINNEFVDPKKGEKFSIYNPADESLVTDSVPIAGPEDIDAAVDGAHEAFKNGPWSKFTAAERAKVMLKFADLLEKHIPKLGKLETLAMGAPPGVTAFIASMAVDTWRYYAGWADKIVGQSFPAEGDGTYKIVTYEPLGVCAGIAPWNAGLSTMAWKCAPALAAGNTVVFKSSEKAPLGALAVGELIKEAGFPPGVIQMVSGPGTTGALLAQHMKVRKISFTGSIPTGKKIQEAAVKSNMKRVTLELGGKSPAIVFNDADIPNAVQFCTMGLLLGSGQVCIASSRTFVQEDIAPKFIEALKESFGVFAKGMRDPSAVAHPLQQLGPMADRAQYERVMSFIEAGKGEAELATGGGRVGDKGFFIEPTLFVNPKSDATIYKQEIFGPVGTVRTFKTEDEVVELANDTTYGLSATLYTSSIARALRVAGRLESGTVGVNTSFSPTVQVPFGGYKESGQGRELGKDGLLPYLETKTISINMNI